MGDRIGTNINPTEEGEVFQPDPIPVNSTTAVKILDPNSKRTIVTVWNPNNKILHYKEQATGVDNKKNGQTILPRSSFESIHLHPHRGEICVILESGSGTVTVTDR